MAFQLVTDAESSSNPSEKSTSVASAERFLRVDYVCVLRVHSSAFARIVRILRIDFWPDLADFEEFRRWWESESPSLRKFPVTY